LSGQETNDSNQICYDDNKERNGTEKQISVGQMTELLRRDHDSDQAGHFGYKKTRAKVKEENVTWKNINETIKKYIKTCKVCQKYKNPNRQILGVIHPVDGIRRTRIRIWLGFGKWNRGE
jgi:Integrase zinc binding domain